MILLIQMLVYFVMHNSFFDKHYLYEVYLLVYLLVYNIFIFIKMITFIYPIRNSIINNTRFTAFRQSTNYNLLMIENHVIDIVTINVNQIIADR